MPYIDPARRWVLTIHLGSKPQTAGELNYLITQLVLEYLGPDWNYQKVNDALGALEGAKLEAYRRLVAPYEDKKIMENGDVYPRKGE